MCGRYRTTYDPEDWYTQLTPLLPFLFESPSDDVRPSTVQPVVVNTTAWSVARLRWGLLPSWAKADTRPQINARSETAFEKPFWRDAVRAHRCVVAVTGYYEWSGQPKHKLRHLFEKPTPGILRLAGIWVPPRANREGSFALMTCEPNEVARAVHDRMPVILEHDDALLRWLAPDELEAGELRDLLVPCSNELLVAHPPLAKAALQGSLF